jgi:hypothetical protein
MFPIQSNTFLTPVMLNKKSAPVIFHDREKSAPITKRTDFYLGYVGSHLSHHAADSCASQVLTEIDYVDTIKHQGSLILSHPTPQSLTCEINIVKEKRS